MEPAPPLQSWPRGGVLMRTLNRSCLSTGGIGGHRIVAADRECVFGAKVENVLRLPDLGKRRLHGDFAEGNLAVGGDVELQVVARLVVGHRRARFGFKHKFLDEGGDVVVADDAELVGDRLLRKTATAGGVEVEEDFVVMLADFVGLERDADRCTAGRAVGDVETPVVLGAFDERARNKAIGQMGVAVGADAVGGVKIAVGGAVNGVGFFFVIEADDVFFFQKWLAQISTQPLTGLPLAVKMCEVGGASARMVGVGSLRLT